MKKIRWAPILIIANLAVIGWVVIRFMNLSYPIVGHDYSLAMPSLLDTYIHQVVNGFGIQWYTPNFGGGVPAFPDPNNGQFSLLEWLPQLVNPWQAVVISSMIYFAVGGLASYHLLTGF